MQRLCDLLEAVIAAIGAALVASFTVLILADVVCRYWLKIPLTWTAELTVVLFQLTCFAGAAIALRRGMHFGLGGLMREVFPRAARVLRPLVVVLVAGTASLIVWLAIRMANQAWNAMLTTLPLSQATIYVALAASAVAMTIFAIEPLVTGRDPDADPAA